MTGSNVLFKWKSDDIWAPATSLELPPLQLQSFNHRDGLNAAKSHTLV